MNYNTKTLRRASRKVINIILLVMLGIISGCAQSKENSASTSIPVGKGPDALFLTPYENYLYVANVEDTVISVIDIHSDVVVQTIDGVNYPWGFTRLGTSDLVAVSGWDKGIDVIDFTSHKIIRQKRYEENLGGIVSSHDGNTIFVVATESNKILKANAATLEVEDEFLTGNGPDGIGISKDGSKLYVTNTKSGSISIIRIADKNTKTIEVGGKPELIHYNHDHSLLYISNFFENKVHIIDTENDEIVHEIMGLNGPEEAVLSASGKRLYVVNFNTSKIFVYDGNSYRKLTEEYDVGAKPIGLVTTDNDEKLYVTNYGDNTVSMIALTK